MAVLTVPLLSVLLLLLLVVVVVMVIKVRMEATKTTTTSRLLSTGGLTSGRPPAQARAGNRVQPNFGFLSNA